MKIRQKFELKFSNREKLQDSQVYLLCKITHDNVTCFLYLCIFISGYNYDVDFADMYRFSYIYFMHWSVQFTHSVVSNSLQPHRLHATCQTFCSIKTPGTCSNSCLQSLWCHPTISFSVVPFSSCFQSFPGSGSFPMSQFFTSCGQSIEASSSFSINPSKDYSGLISFRMDWLDLPAFQGILKSLLQNHSSKESILWHSALSLVQISHPYMTTGKTIALTRRTL